MNNDVTENFLLELKEKEIPADIFLLSGIRLQGKITAFDDQSLSISGQQSLIVFISAIATIVPMW